MADGDGKAVMRNEEIYSESDVFTSERFLSADGGINEDRVLAFGFDRR